MLGVNLSPRYLMDVLAAEVGRLGFLRFLYTLKEPPKSVHLTDDLPRIHLRWAGMDITLFLDGEVADWTMWDDYRKVAGYTHPITQEEKLQALAWAWSLVWARVSLSSSLGEGANRR